jgi:hypothetical protein
VKRDVLRVLSALLVSRVIIALGWELWAWAVVVVMLTATLPRTWARRHHEDAERAVDRALDKAGRRLHLSFVLAAVPPTAGAVAAEVTGSQAFVSYGWALSAPGVLLLVTVLLWNAPRRVLPPARRADQTLWHDLADYAARRTA